MIAVMTTNGIRPPRSRAKAWVREASSPTSSLKSSAERETICGDDRSESYTATRTSGACPGSSGAPLAFDIRRRKKSCMIISPDVQPEYWPARSAPPARAAVAAEFFRLSLTCRRMVTVVERWPSQNRNFRLTILWGECAGALRYGDYPARARLSTGVEKIVDNLRNLLQSSGKFLPGRFFRRAWAPRWCETQTRS